MVNWFNEDDRRRYEELRKKKQTSEKKQDFVGEMNLAEQFQAYGEV